ncbi:Non-specific lipid-transfer protein [Capsicum baccatum]|uniref:Non-specific lipid-transfer protein n=1 Tax=Capsicum baccatum TaxID=33114 RepID=A0A2G2VZT2_CAPBA|nr:Non-specific lipid-transfer protein [Capsicum baccatum]
MVKVALLLVLFIAAVSVMLTPHAEAAISCGEVISKLTPCIKYVTGRGVVTPECCGGIKTLNGQATTTPDRQMACKCLKSAAGAISGINLALASGLPSKCGVNLPYKISPSIDCSTYALSNNPSLIL